MTANLRVAFIDQTGDVAGGAQESLYLLLKSLPDDIDPVVILFSEGVYATKLRALNVRVEIFTIDASISSATREQPAVRGAVAIPRATLVLARLLRALKIDVVHTNSIKAHIIGGLAASLARLPSVAHLRDVLDGRGRLIVRTIVGACSRKRIAISSSVRDNYKLSRTVVIENPIDLEHFAVLLPATQARDRLALPQEVPIAALIGRINRWKGHDIFVRSAASIAAKTDAHFVIVGQARFRDADFVPELRALISRLGLAPRFSFVDWLDDVREIYSAIDLNVNCSLREPFGRTAIEAAAAGVRTVCFDDSGVSEYFTIESGNIAVPAGNESALSQAMFERLTDSVAHETIMQKSNAWAQQFDARRHAKRVASLLRQCAA